MDWILEARRHGFKSTHSHLLAIWPWPGYLASLALGPTSLKWGLFQSLPYRFTLNIKLANRCPVSLEPSTCSINVCCSYYFIIPTDLVPLSDTEPADTVLLNMSQRTRRGHPQPSPPRGDTCQTPRLVSEGSVWDSCGALSDPITETPWRRQIQSDNDGNQ